MKNEGIWCSQLKHTYEECLWKNPHYILSPAQDMFVNELPSFFIEPF